MTEPTYRPGDIAMVEGKPAVYLASGFGMEAHWQHLARGYSSRSSTEVGPVLGNVADIAAAADWMPLSEDVTMHTMAFVSHPDQRMCGYHARLGKWTFEGTKECLRDHPTMAQIMACAPGDEVTP